MSYVWSTDLCSKWIGGEEPDIYEEDYGWSLEDDLFFCWSLPREGSKLTVSRRCIFRPWAELASPNGGPRFLHMWLAEASGILGRPMLGGL